MKPTTLSLFDAPFLVQAAIQPGLFNPVRWYDAASINQANGSLISNLTPWKDLSLTRDDAFSTAGHEPTYQTNVVNGRPTVRFVGARRMLFQGGDLVLQDFTVLCVLLSASDSNYVSHSTFNRQVRTNYLNQARASWFDGNSGTELTSEQFLSNLNVPRMVGHSRSPDLFRFFDNLTEVPPTTGSVDSALFGVNQIGTLGQHATPINCDIAELVIYNTALSTQSIQALYTHYFKPKFALP